MKYVKLGPSGAEVSRICLGTNNFGGQLNEEQASRVIKKAVDLGINFIDTANVYADGRSEEIIGRALKGDRERLVIATKVGYAMSGDPISPDLSRKNILSKVEDSLRRLRTDHIDIYYLHAFDPKTPLAESLRTLDQLVTEGKVRRVGVSNFTADQLRDAARVCEESGLAKPVVIQPRYNLLAREPENDLFPYCLQQGLGVATYSPLAGGFLTGKYRESEAPPDGSRAAFRSAYWERIKDMGQFGRLERLRSVAAEAKVPLGQLAIAWILRNAAVSSPIVGASRPEQVEENCQTLEMRIPEVFYEKLDQLTAR